MTVHEFIVKHGITMLATRIRANPHMVGSDSGMSHWECMFEAHSHGRTLITYFSMGSAHKNSPKAANVLDCLAFDACCGSESFEDFCDNCGYDSDSRKAYKTYEACGHLTKDLKSYLGADAFHELLNETDRL